MILLVNFVVILLGSVYSYHVPWAFCKVGGLAYWYWLGSFYLSLYLGWIQSYWITI